MEPDLGRGIASSAVMEKCCVEALSAVVNAARSQAGSNPRSVAPTWSASNAPMNAVTLTAAEINACAKRQDRGLASKQSKALLEALCGSNFAPEMKRRLQPDVIARTGAIVERLAQASIDDDPLCGTRVVKHLRDITSRVVAAAEEKDVATVLVDAVDADKQLEFEIAQKQANLAEARRGTRTASSISVKKIVAMKAELERLLLQRGDVNKRKRAMLNQARDRVEPFRLLGAKDALRAGIDAELDTERRRRRTIAKSTASFDACEAAVAEEYREFVAQLAAKREVAASKALGIRRGVEGEKRRVLVLLRSIARKEAHLTEIALNDKALEECAASSARVFSTLGDTARTDRAALLQTRRVCDGNIELLQDAKVVVEKSVEIIEAAYAERLEHVHAHSTEFDAELVSIHQQAWPMVEKERVKLVRWIERKENDILTISMDEEAALLEEDDLEAAECERRRLRLRAQITEKTGREAKLKVKARALDLDAFPAYENLRLEGAEVEHPYFKTQSSVLGDEEEIHTLRICSQLCKMEVLPDGVRAKLKELAASPESVASCSVVGGSGCGGGLMAVARALSFNAAASVAGPSTESLMEKFSKKELKNLCADRRLPLKGNKTALAARLAAGRKRALPPLLDSPVSSPASGLAVVQAVELPPAMSHISSMLGSLAVMQPVTRSEFYCELACVCDDALGAAAAACAAACAAATRAGASADAVEARVEEIRRAVEESRQSAEDESDGSDARLRVGDRCEYKIARGNGFSWWEGTVTKVDASEPSDVKYSVQQIRSGGGWSWGTTFRGVAAHIRQVGKVDASQFSRTWKISTEEDSETFSKTLAITET